MTSPDTALRLWVLESAVRLFPRTPLTDLSSQVLTAWNFSDTAIADSNRVPGVGVHSVMQVEFWW
jgi:hypothetical protein